MKSEKAADALNNQIEELTDDMLDGVNGGEGDLVLNPSQKNSNDLILNSYQSGSGNIVLNSQKKLPVELDIH